mmetsp:Transcript_95322/g.273318  ORF Transcript_95322/g.273318 Transcript_95322/m.273318 type:complete len:201 (+) Transcript_95322:249-851(+)
MYVDVAGKSQLRVLAVDEAVAAPARHVHIPLDAPDQALILQMRIHRARHGGALPHLPSTKGRATTHCVRRQAGLWAQHAPSSRRHGRRRGRRRRPGRPRGHGANGGRGTNGTHGAHKHRSRHATGNAAHDRAPSWQGRKRQLWGERGAWRLRRECRRRQPGQSYPSAQNSEGHAERNRNHPSHAWQRPRRPRRQRRRPAG